MYPSRMPRYKAIFCFIFKCFTKKKDGWSMYIINNIYRDKKNLMNLVFLLGYHYLILGWTQRKYYYINEINMYIHINYTYIFIYQKVYETLKK